MIEVSGKPIGTMGIHSINWKDRTATTGALIGEKEYWGKGYGTDAKMTLLDYAFNTLNLRKIMSRVYAFNGRSLAYSLHCGYRVEGRLLRQRYAYGRYWDEIILGLFKSQWLPYWEAYNEK
jgi:RimJ/RimL family protein N-acetyltransferase